MQFDIVLGVDLEHMPHLRRVWPNWQQYKPSLFEHQIIIFYDSSVDPETLRVVVGPDPKLVSWRPMAHYSDDGTKWTKPQRQKMLAGFVYTAALNVKSPYWLKLDLDVIASGVDDWIDPDWFEGDPAIISHPWGYTKPADQMMELDRWLIDSRKSMYPEFMEKCSCLNLAPIPGHGMLSHKRIISWCGFFQSEFTRICSMAASVSCGHGKLPVPSQDGYMWWMAQSQGLPIHRVGMKRRGWIHRSSLKNMDAELEKLNVDGASG
jgi:hypothetical protein